MAVGLVTFIAGKHVFGYANSGRITPIKAGADSRVGGELNVQFSPNEIRREVDRMRESAARRAVEKGADVAATRYVVRTCCFHADDIVMCVCNEYVCIFV